MSDQVFKNNTQRYQSDKDEYQLTANQTLVNATETTVVFDSLTTPNIPGLTYAAGVWTCKVCSVYAFSAYIGYAASVVGGRTVYFTRNGDENDRMNQYLLPELTAVVVQLPITVMLGLIVGDTVRLRTVQGSGGALDILGSSVDAVNYCKLTIVQLR